MRGGGWDFGAVGGNEVELSSVLDLFYFIHYTLHCPQAFSDRRLRFTIEHSRKVSLVKLWYKSNAKCRFFLALILLEGAKNLSGKIRRGSKVVRVSVG